MILAAKNERRRWPRYQAQSGTLLFNERIFAEIINISKGGAFCSYLLAHGEESVPIQLINLIDTKRQNSFLEIPCTDLNYQEPGVNMPLAILRKSRLKFLPVNETFDRDLHQFIENIIADRADSPASDFLTGL